MVLKVMQRMLVKVRRVKQCLGGNAPNIQASATKSATALDTSSLMRKSNVSKRLPVFGKY